MPDDPIAGDRLSISQWLFLRLAKEENEVAFKGVMVRYVCLEGKR